MPYMSPCGASRDPPAACLGGPHEQAHAKAGLCVLRRCEELANAPVLVLTREHQRRVAGWQLLPRVGSLPQYLGKDRGLSLSKMSEVKSVLWCASTFIVGVGSIGAQRALVVQLCCVCGIRYDHCARSTFFSLESSCLEQRSNGSVAGGWSRWWDTFPLTLLHKCQLLKLRFTKVLAVQSVAIANDRAYP